MAVDFTALFEVTEPSDSRTCHTAISDSHWRHLYVLLPNYTILWQASACERLVWDCTAHRSCTLHVLIASAAFWPLAL